MKGKILKINVPQKLVSSICILYIGIDIRFRIWKVKYTSCMFPTNLYTLKIFNDFSLL